MSIQIYSFTDTYKDLRKSAGVCLIQVYSFTPPLKGVKRKTGKHPLL